MKNLYKKHKKLILWSGLILGTAGLVVSASMYDVGDEPQYASVVAFFKNPNNSNIWQSQLSSDEVKAVKKIIGTTAGVNLINKTEAQKLIQYFQKLRV